MSLEDFFFLWEIHPATVHFPIGLLLAGVALELFAWWRGRQELVGTAYGILVAGVLTGVLAALSGFLAFYTLPATHTEEAHTLMYWHLWLQVAAIAVFAAVVLARWRLRRRASAAVFRIIGLVAAGLLVVGSYLGGHLVHRGATGIDPSLLSPALREGHHHDGEGHEHPVAPSQHEPGHDHTHSHEDSHAQWRTGQWNDGVTEWASDGPIIPLFHHSISPNHVRTARRTYGQRLSCRTVPETLGDRSRFSKGPVVLLAGSESWREDPCGAGWLKPPHPMLAAYGR